MDRQRALELLSRSKPELRARFGMARGLVRLDRPQ